MTFSRIFLKPREEKELEQGFPWVYDNEIDSVKFNAQDKSGVKSTDLQSSEIKDGEVVEVFSSKGGFLGTGVFNRKSKITVRLISNSLHADQIMADPAAYWEKIVNNAVSIRGIDFSETDSCRLIFGEADFVPGLICEKYVSNGDVYLVIQFLALASEIFRKEIITALQKVCNPKGIYERSDDGVREKEGLPLVSGWLDGKDFATVLQIKENDITLEVDIANGQKTGYFLDQKFNRKRIQTYVHGKRVLDTCTHTGAFGLNAVKGGAKEVISVDISEDAVAMVNRNIKSNKAEKTMKAVCADVFDLLKQYEKDGEKFDVIILDPPAFTKSAKLIQKAYGGYKEINLRAMRLLNEGGILVTCSCSYYMESTMFYDMIMHAARDSHKKIQVLEKRGAAPDHPVLLGYPKSEYLKCAICRVN